MGHLIPYQLTIELYDNGTPVEGYQAQFNISLMEGANCENTIATLTTLFNANQQQWNSI